jgi:hypothetical protein
VVLLLVRLKIGNTGGTIENIMESKLHRPGSVGFVSKSGGLSNEAYNIISRILFRLGDHFIVHSSSNERQLKDYFNIPGHRISVIAHGPLDFPRPGQY